MRRRRLDAELVERKLARSRGEAHDLIDAGYVLVDGIAATKPSRQVDATASIKVDREPSVHHVSRGAVKLAGALSDFRSLSVVGANALDAGASTGGFTQVLLEGGVRHVVAVDVGYGQLAWPLRMDPRVTVKDRTNVRELRAAELPYAPTLLVGDLSFISLRTVLPALAATMDPAGDMVLLVKPQFEAGRSKVGRRGVVRDPEDRAQAVRDVAASAWGLGLGAAGVTASRLPGPAGNVEFFLWLRRDEPQLRDDELTAAIGEGPA